MSMFTRNDKSEQDQKTAPTPEAARAPATPQARPQAVSQPLVQSVPAPISSAKHAGVSVIGKAVKIIGQIESSEDVQIDGQVEGDVRGQGVSVGANARVKGTVHGESVEVAGTVEGRIEARKVALASTAHVTGDVIHADIRIESGAFIDGHLKPQFAKSAGTKPATETKPAGTQQADKAAAS